MPVDNRSWEYSDESAGSLSVRTRCFLRSSSSISSGNSDDVAKQV
jgi:hypothetical protein